MINAVNIKDILGNVRYSTPVNQGCIWKKEIMKHDQILLKFSVVKPINFQIGDYIETPMGKYELLSAVFPSFNKTTGGYDYELTFNAYYWKWKNKMMFHNRENSKEAAWNLTATPDAHLSVVISNLEALGYKYSDKPYTYSIGDAVDMSAKLVVYNNTSILDALTTIAEAWECEWWVVDNIIHLGRCEYDANATVDFVINGNVATMSRSASNEAFATRIYAFGSTRNIPSNYRPDTNGGVVEGIVQKRLMLPEGIASVDAYEDEGKVLKQEEAVESIVVFEDVYPRMIGEMAHISTKEYVDKIENEDGSTTTEAWTAYRFKDTELEFSTDYVLPGGELRIVFTSGALNGMDFAVSFNPDNTVGEKRLFEIVRNEDYGIPLPGKKMIPANGDQYILYGYDSRLVSDQLIEKAENELLERAKAYVKKSMADPSVYDCQMNMIDVAEAIPGLDIGDPVRLVNPAFFETPRQSRIYGFEKNLDESAVKYIVGNTAQYSRLANMEGQIKEITYNGNVYSAGSGSNVYVIGLYDKTNPSNRNVFSAKRSLKELETRALSRLYDDMAAGHITFNKGLTADLLATFNKGFTAHDFATVCKGIVKEYISSETFIPGFWGEGFKIYNEDGKWTAEVDNIIVRNAMSIYELIISKIRSVNGGLVISPANGRIKSVLKTTDNPAYYVLGIEGDMMFTAGDLVRCRVFAPGEYKSYWVEVRQVSGDTILCFVSDFGGSVPAVGDDLVQFGNTTNVDRQGILYLTASEDGKPRIQVLGGVNSTNLTGKNKAIIGCLDGITDTDFPVEYQPRGYGLYSDNVFLKGLFMLSSGKTVEQDAQEKANAAKGEAIADANGKIDSVKTELSAVPGQITLAVTESKTYADNAVDGIRIGGRNLLRNSPSLQHKKTYTATSNDAYAYFEDIYCELTAGVTYTISYKSDGEKKTGHVGGQDGVGIWLYDGATHWFMGAGRSFEVNKSGKWWIRLNIYLTGKTYSFWDIKVELGNKPTDWTPAPEDVTAEANTLAIAAKDAAIADAVVKYTTKSEFSTSITQLSDSISFKASQTDVNALSSRVSSAEAKITPDAINLTVKSQTESIANDASLVAKGQMLYRDPTFLYGYNNVNMYNNLGNGTVTVERVSGVAGNPNNSGFCLKIVTKGSSTPGWGGFNFGTMTKANRVLVTRIVANIPVGRRIDWHTNPTGNGSSSKWLTSVDGTGGWSEYIHKLTCGANGTFQPTAFFALSGGSAPSEASLLEWYVAFATVYDCTGIDDTPTRDEIKAGISITPGVLNIFGNAVNMTGMVTFSSMSTDAQTKINTAQSTADSALSVAQASGDEFSRRLGYASFADMEAHAVAGQTLIDGGYIRTSLIKADEIIVSKLLAANGTLGILKMDSGGYIDLPPTFTSGKAGRLDSEGLHMVYQGANSQALDWYSGLGTFTGRITCDNSGHLNILSSFGIKLQSEIGGGTIRVGTMSWDNVYIGNPLGNVYFNGAALDNIKKITQLGLLSYAYLTLSMSANTRYHVENDITLIVVTSVGSNYPGIYRITNPGNAAPAYGTVRYILNASTTRFNLYSSATSGATYSSNIRCNDASSEMKIQPYTMVALVYYGGYWYPHTDWGQ